MPPLRNEHQPETQRSDVATRVGVLRQALGFMDEGALAATAGSLVERPSETLATVTPLDEYRPRRTETQPPATQNEPLTQAAVVYEIDELRKLRAQAEAVARTSQEMRGPVDDN